MTKLSIIIPVYNEEPFLRRCLDSVFVNEDVEVIIVDDGSTDGSLRILQKYLDAKRGFKGFRNFANRGVSRSRNDGIDIAQGDYVTFLDADDEYAPDAIGTMLKAINHESAPVIQFNHSRTHFDNLGGLYEIDRLPRKWVLCWNKIYKRSFLNEHKIRFPEGLQFEEDRIFNLRCLCHFPAILNIQGRTVIKHSENKDSLCHTVTPEKLHALTEELMALLEDSKTPGKVKDIARQCLSDLWNSKNARRICEN